MVICIDASGARLPPNEVVMDFTKTERRPLQMLGGHNTLVEGVTTLETSIMSTCDTARIYGYFDREEHYCWVDYFRLLFEQHPNITTVSAHFYCCDNHNPYFLRCGRERMDCVKLYIGSTDSVLYSHVSYEKNPEEDQCIIFDEEMYKDGWTKYPELFEESFNLDYWANR